MIANTEFFWWTHYKNWSRRKTLHAEGSRQILKPFRYSQIIVTSDLIFFFRYMLIMMSALLCDPDPKLNNQYETVYVSPICVANFWYK